MTIFQSLILGIVQGLTEFLPVSSSGHLVFFPALFGWVDQGQAFDAFVHLGTLLAVIVFFWKRIGSILRALFLQITSHSTDEGRQEARLGWLLLFSTIPAVFVGFLLEEVAGIEIRSTLVVALNLIFWGVVLWIADKKSQQLQNFELESVGWKKTLFIGCAQAVALVPGVSRSGITMTAGLFSGLDRKSTAEFSFLMSIPIIAMAGALKTLQLFRFGLGDASVLTLGIGFFASAISGFFAISWAFSLIQKYRFTPFVMYRIALGVILLVFFVMQR